MTKPLVFNYKDYEEIKAENKRLHKENEYLKANLRIEGRKMEYIDRMPTMHEYAEGKRIDPKLTDIISRADAICEVLVNDGIDNIVDRINALPSANADGEDLIIKGGKGIQDGLYNITGGKLFKYKAKGGTVRTYPIAPSADAEQGEWVRKVKEYNDCDGHRFVYWYECSVCGARPPKDRWGNKWHSDYCPSCGARMVKGGDDK